MSPLSPLMSQACSPSPLLNSSHLLSPRFLRTEQACTRRSIYTQKVFAQRNFDTKQLFYRETLPTASFYREKLLHKASFHARLPWNERSNLSCEASFKFQNVNTKLSCEASCKVQEFKMWPHVYDAAVPMHKVSQRMQDKIAQHHQRRDKVTWNHQFHCACSSRYTRRRPHPARKRAYFSPQWKLRLPEKTQWSVQILTFTSRPWFVKTKLSWKASFRFQKLKMWDRSFREASFKIQEWKI